jgi:hypothetical protein
MRSSSQVFDTGARQVAIGYDAAEPPSAGIRVIAID